MKQNILIRSIEVVGVLFAAFGGFLVGIAPPVAADARFAVGISSFFALIILLLVSSLAKEKYERAWIIAAICALLVAGVSAYYYRSIYYELTFEYPPGNTEVLLVAGTELTLEAQNLKRDDPTLSNAELLAGLGGELNRVWPEASLNAARKKLIFTYVILVIALASAIFSLTEGTLASASNGKRKRTSVKVRKAKKQTSKTDTKTSSSKSASSRVNKQTSKDDKPKANNAS